MNDFSIGGAWLHGFRLFAGRWPAHIVILILGVLLPVGAEYAILGSQPPGSAASPTPMGSMIFERPELLLSLGLGFLFQTGSYYTSWRLGFDPARSVSAAPVFGLSAGLIAVICVFIAYVAASYLWMPLLVPDTLFLAIAAFLLPLILVSCIFFVVGIVFAAGAVILFLLLMMILGATNGEMGLAAAVVGGSGAITVLLLVLSGFTFWLAARLSCVTSVMADRKSLNLFAAVAESWRLTWEEQFAITRYLALIGGAFGLLLIALSYVIGNSATSMVPGGETALDGTTAEIFGILIAIPFAFIAVAVPAGIYRQLVGEETPTEIFD